MAEGTGRDEFTELEEMIRRMLEQVLRGQEGALPAGFRIIITGGEIRGGPGSRPSSPPHGVEEPVTEIFEEDSEIRILAEVPGAEPATTHLQITGRMLRIYADGGGCRYKTSLELPPVVADTLTSRIHHGVLEITLVKSPPA